jgi:uncharacterized protein with GYD domain
MPRYLVQASYTTQGISDLVKNPQDRAAALRPMVERLGGKLVSLDFAFGEYDAVAILELPDNVTMAALSMAAGAIGGISKLKTTVLIPMNEAVEAMRKAGTVSYRPPGR